jgi:hypothetical protein
MENKFMQPCRVSTERSSGLRAFIGRISFHSVLRMQADWWMQEGDLNMLCFPRVACSASSSTSGR